MIENQIVNKAIDYIFSHIEKELSVDGISQYVGYSKFYLTRIFKAETGESIYSFIKRLKVEQSAWRLKVEKSRSITEIGNEFGYSSSNYATLFREHFEKTPAQFRKDISTINNNNFAKAKKGTFLICQYSAKMSQKNILIWCFLVRIVCFLK